MSDNKQIKNILCVDLGTKCGYALLSHHAISYGTENFAKGRFDSAGMRFIRFERWLDGLWSRCGEHTPDIVYYEAVRRHLGTDAAHAYGGYLAILQKFCDEKQIPYTGLAVQSIKKNATGHGNAKKDAVINAVKSWGFWPKDDNSADALAILDIALKDNGMLGWRKTGETCNDEIYLQPNL